MAKPKIPFKRHPLPRPQRQEWAPSADKKEGTDIRQRGYFPGSSFTTAELRFIQAIDALRRRTGRKFLSAIDHLRVVAELGWLLLPADLDRPHTGTAQ